MIEFKKSDEVSAVTSIAKSQRWEVTKKGVQIAIAKEKDDVGKSILRWTAVQGEAEIKGEGYILREVLAEISRRVVVGSNGIVEAAKAEKQQTREEIADPDKPKRPPTRTKIDKTFKLTFVKDAGEIEASYLKLPPQAKSIVDILVSTGKDVLPEAFVREAVNEKAELLKTKQDPVRIWEYYRSKLIAARMIQEVAS